MTSVQSEILEGQRSVTALDSIPEVTEPAVVVGPYVAEPSAVPKATPKRPHRKAPFAVSVTSWALATLSFLALWALAFAFVLSGWNQAGAQRRLYAQVREEIAAQTGPIGGKIPIGDPVAVVEVPKLKIDKLVVVEGTSGPVLRAGPGHRRDTPLPGQPGSSVIMGRNLLYGGPFDLVPELDSGDRISVTTGQGRFTYIVDGVRRGGDAVPPLEKSVKSRLTLVTGDGEGVDSEAVFVDAHLDGKPQAPPEKGPKGVDAVELPMAGDPGALVLVVLYLQLLVAVLVGVVWLAARWRTVPAVVIGIPLVLSVLWLVTDAAAMLLPNLA
jgi:sortase A